MSQMTADIPSTGGLGWAPSTPYHAGYQYIPLDHDCSMTRVLELYPAYLQGDELRGQLHLLDLSIKRESFDISPRLCFTVAHAVDYEDLSYVWGDAAPVDHIIIDNRTLRIGHNLSVALRALRSGRNRSRLIWADAICINQEDDAERSAQVALMPLIFRRATRAIAWLGDEISTIDMYIILRFLSWLPEFVEDELKSAIGGRAPCPFRLQIGVAIKPFNEQEAGTHRCMTLGKLGALRDLHYFSRRWIVQEVMVAKVVNFCYGQHYIPEELFARALDHLITDDSPVSCTDRLMRVLNFRRDQKAPEIIEMLELFRDFDCSDARDFVAALSGISYVWQSRVDYTASVEENYINFALVVALNGEDQLRYLLCSAARRQPLQLESDVALPTWCPDWRVAPRTHPLEIKFNLYDRHDPSLDEVTYLFTRSPEDIKRVDSIPARPPSPRETRQCSSQELGLMIRTSASRRHAVNSEGGAVQRGDYILQLHLADVGSTQESFPGGVNAIVLRPDRPNCVDCRIVGALQWAIFGPQLSFDAWNESKAMQEAPQTTTWLVIR